jgi:hypothetical protein
MTQYGGNTYRWNFLGVRSSSVPDNEHGGVFEVINPEPNISLA